MARVCAIAFVGWIEARSEVGWIEARSDGSTSSAAVEPLRLFHPTSVSGVGRIEARSDGSTNSASSRFEEKGRQAQRFPCWAG